MNCILAIYYERGKKPFDSRWHVVQFGEKNGVEDLGRDIIADRIGVGGKE